MNDQPLASGRPVYSQQRSGAEFHDGQFFAGQPVQCVTEVAEVERIGAPRWRSALIFGDDQSVILQQVFAEFGVVFFRLPDPAVLLGAALTSVFTIWSAALYIAAGLRQLPHTPHGGAHHLQNGRDRRPPERR